VPYSPEDILTEFVEAARQDRRPPPFPRFTRLPSDEGDRFIAASDVERAAMRQAHVERRAELASAGLARDEQPPPRSVRASRPNKLTPTIRQRIRSMERTGISDREIARRLDVSRATIARSRREPRKLGRPVTKMRTMVEAFIERLRKHGLIKRVRMLCHGREIPEDDLGSLHEGKNPLACMARVDLSFVLFRTMGWTPKKIAELFGPGFLRSDIEAWLEGRGVRPEEFLPR
jgi:biotin operon repressor